MSFYLVFENGLKRVVTYTEGTVGVCIEGKRPIDIPPTQCTWIHDTLLPAISLSHEKSVYEN